MLVVAAGRRGTVVHRRSERGQPSVAHVERLAWVEQEDAIRGDRILQGKNAQPDEGRDNACGGRGLKDLHQASGVVAVRMGQVDPAQVSGIDLIPERLQEVRPRGGQAAVDEHRLLGVEDIGIHRQEAQAGNGCGVGQGDDVGGGT